MKKDHPKRFFRGDQNVGFTLVEILATVSVIGILAGIVLAAAGAVQTKAARDQAKTEIKTMCVAMERYKTDYGAFPKEVSPKTNVLYGYLTNYMTFRENQISRSGTNVYVIDPYGRPYFYVSPPVRRSRMVLDGFEIWSLGAKTNANDSSDDIGSWD